MNAPRSVEGDGCLALTAHLEGQLRIIPGAVVGFDLTAALAAADAMGIDRAAVVELLPVIEARMVAAQLSTSRCSQDRTGTRRQRWQRSA